ncbi:hypothetical protein ACEQPO_27605 [Bacillus sp. SL00103]
MKDKIALFCDIVKSCYRMPRCRHAISIRLIYKNKD